MTRIMNTPARLSPAIIPDAAGTTYSVSAALFFSMKRTMRAPMNIEREFQKGITNASPIPIEEGIYLEAFGKSRSITGIIMPTRTPTIIAILAV